MPGWGDALSRRELDGLVAHVLSLAPSRRPDDEPLPAVFRDLIDRAGFVAEATPAPAPPLNLIDLDGRPTSLADRHGRPVLVLFWGTTCAACLEELPAVLRLAGPDLDVLPVCVDASEPSSVRDAVGPDLPGHPLYLDPGGLARLHYDVQSLPSFALIDPAGRLVSRAQGARDWSALASSMIRRD
jgi:thiol-disulfide isomerase/thioredoxin